MIELIVSCAMFWHTQFLPPAGWTVEKIDPQYSNVTGITSGTLTITSGGSMIRGNGLPIYSDGRDGREITTPRILVTMRRTVGLKEKVDLPTAGECTQQVSLK